MKKLIAVLVCLSVIVMSTSFVLVTDASATSGKKIIRNEKYQFVYTESTDENHRIIREYHREEQPSAATYSRTISDNSETSTEYMKEVLTSLGMGEAFVNELSVDDLEDYANSEHIRSVVTYMKTDESGETVNISEEEALSVAAVDPGNDMIDLEDGNGYPSSVTTNISTDDYMRLGFIVSYEGDGLYKFSIDAEWLITPIFRMTDYLGACAQNFAVEDYTRSGWYMYDKRTVDGSVVTEVLDRKETLSTFENVTGKGNWDGSSVSVNLKNDAVENETNSIRFTNHRVHYEFKMTIHQWQFETNFNATAAYLHVMVAIQPTLSITSEANYGATLGFTFNFTHERYPIGFDTSLKHIP